MDQSSSYGGAPQSTIGNSARRIQAQLPAEPPACVQNAMMRRDKQPFTYTPGGIDLSQIKSPRMAKRISRNAQSEGVSTQPKVSPLAQNNINSSSSQQAVSPAATLGAAAMGMPFQVFPTGPPAPPPPPPPNVGKKPTMGQTNGNSASAPPPPPPPVPSLEKKTPKPQTFEPPPMGCRPEIKIPPNPMANLRKAPRPQPKNDFWIEEYRNERRNDMPNPVQQLPVYNTREADEEAPPSPPKPAPAPKQQQAPQSATIVSRPQTIELSPPTQPAISQTHYIQLQNPVAKVTPQPVIQQGPPVAMQTVRNYQQAPVYVQNQMYPPQPAANQKQERIIPIQIEQSPIKTPVSAPSFAPPPYYSPGPQYNPVQSPLTVGYPGPHSGFTTPTAMFTNPNHFVNQGYNNISYPPTSPQHPMYQQHHQHYQQQSPSVQQQQQHQQMMQQQRMQQQTPTQQPGGVRIIPIKVENNDNGATATTVRGPLSQTPAIIQSGDHRYIIHDIPLEAKLRFLKNRLSDPRSHNNPQAWNGNNAPNQSRSFRVLQHITDTMEDAESRSNPSTPKPSTEQQTANHVEGAESQLRSMQLSKDDKALMNRVKNQVDGEVYLHNEEDPRYRGAAIPSKAFRYLQNITDGGQASSSNSAGSNNRTNQMFVQNRGNATESEDETAQQYIPPSEQRVEEPKKYTGSAIPSRSFKMLQAMTQSDAPEKI